VGVNDAAHAQRVQKYIAILEAAGDNVSAYVPELPGCIATGRTVDDVTENIRDAIEFHLDGLREDGVPIPEPTVRARSIVVAV
jgi:predicted RNase H-like HicB family nuclease